MAKERAKKKEEEEERGKGLWFLSYAYWLRFVGRQDILTELLDVGQPGRLLFTPGL